MDMSTGTRFAALRLALKLQKTAGVRECDSVALVRDAETLHNFISPPQPDPTADLPSWRRLHYTNGAPVFTEQGELLDSDGLRVSKIEMLYFDPNQ